MRTEPDIFTVVTYKSKGIRIYLRTTKHYYVVEGWILGHFDEDEKVYIEGERQVYYRTRELWKANREFERIMKQAEGR